MSERRRNGLTDEQYDKFFAELRAAPCTRRAIDALHVKWFGSSDGARYPDEYYADKNNRMAGKPTGNLRCLVSRGGVMVWVSYEKDCKNGVAKKAEHVIEI